MIAKTVLFSYPPHPGFPLAIMRYYSPLGTISEAYWYIIIINQQTFSRFPWVFPNDQFLSLDPSRSPHYMSLRHAPLGHQFLRLTLPVVPRNPDRFLHNVPHSVFGGCFSHCQTGKDISLFKNPVSVKNSLRMWSVHMSPVLASPDV